jgi:hypothetical protein
MRLPYSPVGVLSSLVLFGAIVAGLVWAANVTLPSVP